MKIRITRGCVAYNVTFDDVSIGDDSYNPAAILDYILPKLREQVLAGCIPIESVVELFPSLTDECDDHVCESCGDSVSWTTWEI